MSWTGEEQPAPLKRECASCGRSAYVNRRTLCDQCQADWDAEMTTIDEQERYEDDRLAARLYYGR